MSITDPEFYFDITGPAAYCKRDAGHSGPCNGYPRLDDGRYCYALRSGATGHQEHHAYGARVHVPYSGQAEGYSELRTERDDLRVRVRELESQIRLGTCPVCGIMR